MTFPPHHVLSVFQMLVQEGYLALTAVSFVLCVLIILFKGKFTWLNGRAGNLGAIQSMHSRCTPRVGGIAIFGAIALSVFFAPPSISVRYLTFLGPVSLIFVVGLLEDLGGNISPRMRLLAAVMASFLVIIFLKVWLPRLGIPRLDFVLQYWAVGIPLTLLITAGVANGFNLIDGVNGLACLNAIATALAMSFIAREAGYTDMGHLAMMIVASVFGFLLVNYPLGYIFLGDAGAYTLGFVLSWFGVSIILRAPHVSPWAILLTLFWPVADMLLAIYRRSRRKAAVSAPDRLHVHHVMMRGLEICIFGRNRRRIVNPLTTFLMTPLVIAPSVAGALLWDQNRNAFIAVLVFGLLFFASYAVAPAMIRRFRRRSRWLQVNLKNS